jgi:hypothetical protein
MPGVLAMAALLSAGEMRCAAMVRRPGSVGLHHLSVKIEWYDVPQSGERRQAFAVSAAIPLPHRHESRVNS